MPVKKEKEAVSAFEERRLKNIRANNEILKDLSSTASKIAPPPPPKPQARPRPKRQPVEKREQPKRERAVATRTSSRLKGETPKREADDSAPVSLFPPDRPAKKARVNEDLNLGDILVEGRKFTNGVDAVTGLISLPRLGAEPGVRTFDEDDIKETTDEDLRKMRETMNSLELYDKWAVNGGLTITQTVVSGLAADLDAPQTLKLCLNAFTRWGSIPLKRNHSFLPETKKAPWGFSMHLRKSPRSTTAMKTPTLLIL
jgi:hypothetical protein